MSLYSRLYFDYRKNDFIFVIESWVFKLDFAALSLNFLTLDSMEVVPERTFFSLLGPLTGPRAKKV